MTHRRERRETVRSLYADYEPLVVVSLLWFLVQFLRFAFPPLFGTIQAEFGVSNTETGLLFTALMMAYAVMQFPAGALSDRIGRPQTITVGAMVFSAVGVAILLAVDFRVLFGLAVLLGAATAGHKTVSINVVSNRYPTNTGFCLGVLDTVGQFGGVAAPVVAVALLSSLGWRWTFAVAGVAGFALAGVNRLRVGEPAGDSPSDGDEAAGGEDRWTYLDIFADGRLVVFVVVAMAFTFAWNAVSAFLPLYLTTEKGVTTRLSSLLYSAFFVVSLSQLATGRVSDSVGRLWIGLGTFAGMAVAVFLLLFAEGAVAVSALTLAMGVAFHGFRPVRDSYLMSLIPDTVGGGSLGIVRTGMIVVGSVSPTVVGFVADAAGFRPAFGVVLAAVVVGGVLTGALALTESNGG